MQDTQVFVPNTKNVFTGKLPAIKEIRGDSRCKSCENTMATNWIRFTGVPLRKTPISAKFWENLFIFTSYEIDYANIILFFISPGPWVMH